MAGGAGPTGSAAFGGSGGETIYAMAIVETLLFSLIGDGISATVLTDGLGMNGQLTAETLKRINEQLRLTGAVSVRWEGTRTLTDELRYSEAIGIAWQLALAEQIDVVGAASSDTARLAAIVDTLHATGAVSARLDAYAAVATALAVNGLIKTGWKMSAFDTVEFQDALAGQIKLVRALLDTIGMADLVSPSMRVLAVMSDTIAVDDELSATLQAFASLADEVLFYTTLRFGDAEYIGWAINGGAASEYRNYPFNGFVEFPKGSKKYYGTSDDGLFLLEGVDDDSKPIDAFIRTALMDFGTGFKKSIPDVYLAFKNAETMVLRVITTDTVTGLQREDWYTAALPPGGSLHNGRFKIGGGLKSRYWQMELRNVDGAQFELDELAFRLMILDRRL